LGGWLRLKKPASKFDRSKKRYSEIAPASKFSRDLQPSPVLQVLTQGRAIKEIIRYYRIGNGHRKPKNQADLVMLGDYWLTLAIRQKLIQPVRSC
jgi:putative spermidine/putrescine transport system substrate-binding protein